MNPIILYDNILRTASSVTASTTASGYAAANLYDYRGYTKWKSSNTSTQNIDITMAAGTNANCLGIFNHNLGTIGATIKVQYDDGGYQTLKTLNPADDSTILEAFTLTEDTAWRIEISSISDAVEIGQIFLGVYLEMPYPPNAPAAPYEETIKLASEYSEAGHLLGTVVAHYQLNINHNYSNLTKTFVDNYFLPFWNNHARLIYPFFYAWDLTNAPSEIYFVTIDPTMLQSLPRTVLTYIDNINLQMRGVSL